MLQVGHVFKRDGQTFCLIDFVDYGEKRYALFSVEAPKIIYVFYEINQNETGYNLIGIHDDDLNNKLLSIFEEKNKDE